MEPMQKLPDLVHDAHEEAAALEARYGRLEPELVLELAVDSYFPDQVAAISSFGTGSAVLLHMISEIDRNLPVIFLDTGKHFPETLEYRERLIDELGLTDVSNIKPETAGLKVADADGKLHRTDADACCAVRKVEPMARAVKPWRAWITGRKRYQGQSRQALPMFEAVEGRIRINPLAAWRPVDMAAYSAVHKLPAHPLREWGYLSVGCMPCTNPAEPGTDERSGRWAGLTKTECGIHLSGLERSLSSSSL